MMQPFAKRPLMEQSSQDGQIKRLRPANSTSLTKYDLCKPPPLPPISLDYEKAVFTHSSIAVQRPENPNMVNYERLEFLGDAQLEHIASLVIFDRYTSAAPGKMSTMRELLVKNDTLCEFSRAYGFDKKLKIVDSPQIAKDRVKIYADIFEAYVAAVILSNSNTHSGFDEALKWMTALWEPKLRSLGMQQIDVKSKEELAKKVLAKGIKLNYQEEQAPVFFKKSGTQTYFMGVYLSGWGYQNQYLGSGEGSSKKEAEQDAAAAALANYGLMEEIEAKRTEFLNKRQNEATYQRDNRILDNSELLLEAEPT